MGDITSVIVLIIPDGRCDGVQQLGFMNYHTTEGDCSIYREPLGASMLSRLILTVIVLLLIPLNVHAEFSVHLIDNRLEAVFPGEPQFIGEFGQGVSRHKGFNYVDETNQIIYTASYQVGEVRFKQQDVPEALHNYVKGKAIALGGRLEKYTPGEDPDIATAIFLITYSSRNIAVRLFGVVSYNNGHFAQWSVQDFPSESSLDGEDIFNTYISKYKVTNLGYVHGTSNFVHIQLPKGVKIEIPINWIVYSENRRITLDSCVEAHLDLTDLNWGDSKFRFAASYYDDTGKAAGIVNIRYYPDVLLTQQTANNFSREDILELDKALRDGILKTLEGFGATLESWDGTKRKMVNGIVTFQTEYLRKAEMQDSSYRVKLVRVFSAGRSFTLTVSYRNAEEWFALGKITQRIVSSLEM